MDRVDAVVHSIIRIVEISNLSSVEKECVRNSFVDSMPVLIEMERTREETEAKIDAL